MAASNDELVKQHTYHTRKRRQHEQENKDGKDVKSERSEDSEESDNAERSEEEDEDEKEWSDEEHHHLNKRRRRKKKEGKKSWYDQFKDLQESDIALRKEIAQLHVLRDAMHVELGQRAQREAELRSDNHKLIADNRRLELANQQLTKFTTEADVYMSQLYDRYQHLHAQQCARMADGFLDVRGDGQSPSPRVDGS